MKSKFSSIMLDMSKVKGWVTQWCELTLEDPFEVTFKEKGQRVSCEVINNGKKILVDFIKCNGGAYTVSYKVGQHQDISEQIAEYIYERCSCIINKSPFSNGLTVKMNYDNFQILISLLTENENISVENYSKHDEPGKAKYEQYKLKSTLKDTVTLKYFTCTKRLQIQGKPLFLFEEITSLICDSEAAVDDVVDAHIKLCDLSVKKDDIFEELSYILGSDVYNYMTETQRRLMGTSLVLSKMVIDCEIDYSYIIQQALRAYEGLLKKMMCEKGVRLAPNKSVGFHFAIKNKTPIDYSLKKEYTAGLDSKYVDVFERMYVFYHSNRHPYMHANDLDITTSIIGTFDEAINKLNDIVRSIKENFAIFIS